METERDKLAGNAWEWLSRMGDVSRRMFLALVATGTLGLGVIIEAVRPPEVKAWGPITHLKTAQMADGNPSDSFLTGSIIPDVILANNIFSRDTSKHNLLHKPEYLATLTQLAAETEDQDLWDFTRGYRLHLDGDSVESRYSGEQMLKGAKFHADYAVDRLLAEEEGRVRIIQVTEDQAKLMVDAWDRAYPDQAGQLNAMKIITAVFIYNIYFVVAYPLVAPPETEAREWYGDYEEKLDDTVRRFQEMKEIIYDKIY